MPGQSTAADRFFSTASQKLGERPASFAWASVRREFASNPTRVHSALKLALGGTITLVLAYWFNWSSPANAMVPPLLLNRPDIRFDLRQSLIAGASAAVMGSFYYWSLNFSQSPLWFALVLGGGLMCYGTLTTLPGIGQSLSIGQVIPSLVLALYFYAPNAQESLYLPRTMELLLGFTVAIAVNGLLWPYSPRKEWDERFQRAWGECRETSARWFAGEEVTPGKVSRPDGLDRQLEEVLGLLGERIKPTDPADEGPAIRTAAVRRLEEIIFLLQDLRRLGLRAAPGVNPALNRLGREIDGSFAALEGVLAGKASVPVGEPDDAVLMAAFPDSPESGESAAADDLLRRADLRRLREVLGGCPEAFRALARLPAAESVTRREQSLIYSAPPRLEDLRQLGAQSWQHGAKIALIVLSSFVLWQAFRWPGGPTVVASALIVTLTDLGRAARQAILRVLGLLLGMACAFLCTVLVVKYVETIYGYGLCVFVVLLVLGYLAGTSPRLAYIGFQGAVSFVLVFISDDQQSVSLLPLFTRFAGLIFGVAIATVILQNVWPVRKVKDLFAGLADNLAVCAGAWTALFQKRPEGAAGQEQWIDQFNQGWAKSVTLVSNIEFEGGEGTPRYGYAGRVLTHETALFEQIRLCGVEWNALARAGASPPAKARAIQAKFQALTRQLGHPVELSAPEPDGPSEAPAPDAQVPPDQRALEQRLGEIEQILASLERLATQAVST